MLISDRIAHLEFDLANKVYRPHPNRVATWGEDALMSPDFYSGVVRNHIHVSLPVILDSGEIISALGLKSDVLNSKAYVEVDDWEQPIRIDETELVAVRILDHALSGNLTVRENVEELAGKLLEFTKAKNTSLRLAMFRRIQYHCQSGSHLARNIPPRLYWLLPWHLFDSHVERLNQILADGVTGGISTKPELPDLGSFFRPVRPGLAPSLRQMTEWRDRQEPERGEHVRN